MDRDTEEALALLRDAEMARRQRTPSKARVDATQKLFEELLALDGKYGLKVHVDDEWNQLEVQLGGAHGFVTFHMESGIRVGQASAGSAVVVELDLDPDTGRLVGRDVDTFRLPSPGDAKRRRPALAVLVDAVIKALAPRRGGAA